MTRDERLAKVRDCCQGALPKDAVERLIALVEGLSGAPSVGPLMDLLRGATPLSPDA